MGGGEKIRPESAVVCGQPGQRERETEWAVRHTETKLGKSLKNKVEKEKRIEVRDGRGRSETGQRGGRAEWGEESVSHCLTVGC